MIDFYTWKTPNGRKIGILLEETRLDYTVRPVNIDKGEQFASEFLAISPNNKIPAIVDHAPGGDITIFESGAILVYLAEKTGQFLPTDAKGRSAVLQWLFWQVGGFGPMLGQFRHFLRPEAEGSRYCIDRYTKEAARLMAVLEKRLGENEFVADAYSIADMAIYPWSVYARGSLEKATGLAFANVARWEAAIALRPAVGRGMGTPA